MDQDELRKEKVLLRQSRPRSSSVAGDVMRRSLSMFSKKVDVVIHTCGKCVFQLQIEATERLLRGWFPNNLKFGPHVMVNAYVDGERDRWNRNLSQCTGALDCLCCFADKTNDFDVYVDGILVHSKKARNHGFPAFAFNRTDRTITALELRQASLQEAIQDILGGRAPDIENSAEAAFRKKMDAEDRQYDEELAARQKAKKDEQEAWQKSEEERLVAIRKARQLCGNELQKVAKRVPADMQKQDEEVAGSLQNGRVDSEVPENMELKLGEKSRGAAAHGVRKVGLHKESKSALPMGAKGIIEIAAVDAVVAKSSIHATNMHEPMSQPFRKPHNGGPAAVFATLLHFPALATVVHDGYDGHESHPWFFISCCRQAVDLKSDSLHMEDETALQIVDG